jgi:hypothetical protein
MKKENNEKGESKQREKKKLKILRRGVTGGRRRKTGRTAQRPELAKRVALPEALEGIWGEKAIS